MQRISKDEILKMALNDDLKTLGKKAFEIKRELHPKKITTLLLIEILIILIFVG